MQGQIATFFTFQKEDAEQAMNLYISLFENSEILDVQRWGQALLVKKALLWSLTLPWVADRISVVTAQRFMSGVLRQPFLIL